MGALRSFGVVLILLALCFGCKKKPAARPYPLHWAVGNANRAEVLSLLAAGVDINSRDSIGLTPLQYAAKMGHVGMVELLISHGADLDVNSPHWGWGTPLHCAAWEGHTVAAKRLIAAGASIDSKDSWRRATPLQAAFHRHQIRVTELLLSAGADPNARDEWGRTMLHDAALNGQTDFAELFTAKGASLNARDNERLTPLHEAAWENRLEMAKFLLTAGVEVNARDAASQTPFHVAAINGFTELFDLLAANGADANLKDEHGLTPLDYLRSGGARRIAAVPLRSEEPYSVIITNPDAVRKFLRTYRILYDRIWIPSQADIDGLDQVLKSALENDPVISKNTWFDREFVQDHFGEYCSEFSGFIKNDTKYVICGMVLSDGSPPVPPGDTFSQVYIADGGCGILRVIFNAEIRSIVKVECNGN